MTLVCFNSDGSLDTTFGQSGAQEAAFLYGNANLGSLVLSRDEKFIAAGPLRRTLSPYVLYPDVSIPGVFIPATPDPYVAHPYVAHPSIVNPGLSQK